MYPKIQLILIIEELTDKWKERLRKLDFDKYNVVDILIFSQQIDIIKNIGFLLQNKKVFLRSCLPVEDPIVCQTEHYINFIVRDDCEFYLLIDDPDNELIEQWPDKVDNFLSAKHKNISMIVGDADYNNVLIFSPLHIYINGYGSQSVPEKVRIYCANEERNDLIHTVEELFHET